MLLSTVGVLVGVAGAAFLLVARRAKRSGSAARERKAVRRFGAVEIQLRAGACDEARSLEGQRFLATEAPPLPLPACTAGQCSCVFAKLIDRRTDEERRFEHGGLSTSLFAASNRRTKSDRRAAEPPPPRP